MPQNKVDKHMFARCFSIRKYRALLFVQYFFHTFNFALSQPLEMQNIHTAVLPQNRSFDSVWSKIGTLQDCIVLCKSAATPLPTLRFLTTNESFQMRYCMNFFFKGHQNCQKSNLKVHEKSCFIKWIWKAKTLTSGHSDAPWGKSSYSTSFESSH